MFQREGIVNKAAGGQVEDDEGGERADRGEGGGEQGQHGHTEESQNRLQQSC